MGQMRTFIVCEGYDLYDLYDLYDFSKYLNAKFAI